MTETTPNPRIFLAIMGRCLLDKQKPGYAYQLVEKTDVGYMPVKDVDWYGYKKRLTRGNIGKVVSIEVNPEKPTSVYSTTIHYVGQVADESLIHKWQLDDELMGMKIETKKKLSEPINTELDRLIEVVGEYVKTHPLQRRLIVARLLTKLL